MRLPHKTEALIEIMRYRYSVTETDSILLSPSLDAGRTLCRWFAMH